LATLKTNRSYLFNYLKPDGSSVQIDYNETPFTMEFDITRSAYSDANVCQIRFFNLGVATRNFIRFDFSNYGVFNQMQIRAGYGVSRPLIFAGNVSSAWSVRQGKEFITTIECMDGSYAFTNGTASKAFVAGTPMEVIYKYLISTLPNISFGGISQNFITDSSGNQYVLQKDQTFEGNSAAILFELTGGAFYVDLQKGYIQGDNYLTEGDAFLVNAQTGLIGTPVKQNGRLDFEMIFEPGLQVGRQVNIQSLTAELYGQPGQEQTINGVYKSYSVKHAGIISPSVGGTATTSVEVNQGSQALSQAGFYGN